MSHVSKIYGTFWRKLLRECHVDFFLEASVLIGCCSIKMEFGISKSWQSTSSLFEQFSILRNILGGTIQKVFVCLPFCFAACPTDLISNELSGGNCYQSATWTFLALERFDWLLLEMEFGISKKGNRDDVSSVSNPKSFSPSLYLVEPEIYLAWEVLFIPQP